MSILTSFVRPMKGKTGTVLDITDGMAIVEFDANGNQYQEIKNVKMSMLGKMILDSEYETGELTVKGNTQPFINRVPSVLTKAEKAEKGENAR